MRPNNVLAVVKREYTQRVKTKGFWIGTLALPLFMAALTVVPGLMMSKTTDQNIVVVDETGRGIGKSFAGGGPREVEAEEMGRTKFTITAEEPRPDREAQIEDLKQRVLAETIDAWIWIPKTAIDDGKVQYHARSVSNFMTQTRLERQLTDVIRRVRFTDAGIDADRVGELSKPVDMETVRVSREGSIAQRGEAAFFFAYILFFMLYMLLILWGQQVMNGVIEEKGSRVVEVVISSITPFELMMGKLTGICLAGLTQFGVWLVTAAILTAPGIMASMALLPAGSIPTLSPAMVLHFLLLFVLGFFVFSSIYAAIGASFNNLQEAQQAASVAIVFIIIPMILMFRIINAPNSTFAVVTSLIPLFTPQLMTLRIAIEMPPLWQLLLSYALTTAFVVAMVWLCARIYRVGILMYGKKPTFKEILRWVRYA